MGPDPSRFVSTMEEAASKPSSKVVAVVGGGLVRKEKCCLSTNQSAEPLDLRSALQLNSANEGESIP